MKLGVLRKVFPFLLAAQFLIVVGSMIFNGQDMFRNMPAARQWGLVTYTNIVQAPYVYIGEVDAAADRAGLRRYDRFVAIAGKPVAASATEFDIGAKLAAAKGDGLIVTTRSPDGRRGNHVLHRTAKPWLQPHLVYGMPLWLFALTTYLSVQLIPLVLIAAAFLLYLRRPMDTEALMFATGFVLLANEANVDFWLLSLFNIPAAVFGALVAVGQIVVVFAAAGFPGSRYDTRLSRFVAVTAAPAIVALYLIRYLAPAATAAANAALTVVMLSAVVTIVLRYRSVADSSARQQIKWFVLGFAVSVSASLTIAILPQYSDPSMRGIAGYYVFYQLLRLVEYSALPLGLLISLLRFRLYDAETTISRSAAYVTLSVAMLAVFTATERVIEVMGEEVYGGATGAIAGGASAALVAVMVAPAHHRIDRWAKRHFQRGLIRLSEELPDMVGDLREVASPGQIAEAAAELIYAALHTTAVSVETDREVLAKLEAASDAGPDVRPETEREDVMTRVPLGFARDDPGAWLVLGPRPDGSALGKDELQALSKAAGHLGRALDIASQRERARMAQEQAMTRLARRVAKVERAIAATPAAAERA
jgi:hypothetical protein